MNYFDFYDLEESFFINEKSLKKFYLEKSREYHPDFHSLKDEKDKEHAIKMSALNNQAYETLKSFDKRVEYILQQNQVLGKEGQNKVPSEFLMEMMELNEALMELKFDPDQDKLNSVRSEVESFKQKIYQEVEQDMMKYVKDAEQSEASLDKIKDYYLKNKYLNRLEEQLNA